MQKANYRTALWKLGTLPKFSKTVMADLNLVWDMNIRKVCLTALSKNHFFGPPEVAVPKNTTDFNQTHYGSTIVNSVKYFIPIYFFKFCFKDYCFYSDC